MNQKADSYDSVETTEEEDKDLLVTEQPSSDNQTNSDNPDPDNPEKEQEEDKGESEKSESKPEVRLFKTGDKEMSREDYLEELEDDTLDNMIFAHERQTDWEKSNTQKAQATADQSKLIQPLLDLKNQITDNKELLEAFDDVYKDILKSETGISEILLNEDLEKISNPFQDELDILKQYNADFEEARSLEDSVKAVKVEVATLEKKGLTDRQIDTLAKECNERFENDGVRLSMEEQLKLKHPEWGKKAKAPKTNKGTSQQSSKTNKDAPKTYEEVSIKEFADLLE